MPKTPWNGYGRFCPLARGLDVIGERWTLIIMQEVMFRPSRYGELMQRLPGISTTVLADRLRKLEAAGVVERRPDGVGGGVLYAATERGMGLEKALEELRRWGVGFLTSPSAGDSDCQVFDIHYVEGIDALEPAEFGLVVDDVSTTLRFSGGMLEHAPGKSDSPQLTVITTSTFMDSWAAGASDWDSGLRDGHVRLIGSEDEWPHFLAATGYLLRYDPDPVDD